MENCDYLPEMIAAPEEENITMEVEDDDVLTDDDDDDGLPVVEQREKLLQEDIFQEVPKIAKISIARPSSPPTRKLSAELRKKAALEGTEIPKSVRRKKELIETQKLIVTEKEKLSKAEIEEITFNAIAKHEELRKIRKEEKKKAQLEAQHTAHVQTTIRRAVGQPNPNDIWASALSGMFN